MEKIVSNKNNLQILFEDNHIIAINKRCGDIVQGDKTGDTPLSEIIKSFIKEKYKKPGNVYLGVPHRLDRPTSGQIFLKDQDISTLNDKQLTKIRRDSFGFVFQAFNLIPTLTAEENITLPASISGKKPDMDWIKQVVDTVDIGDRLTHRPNELSGGQQQRVAAARAMATKPEVIFADEPSGNLDSKSSKELLTFMKSVVEELNQTIIMVTHDPYAASYASRVIMLKDGSIASDLKEPTQEEIVAEVTALTNI